MDSAKTPFSSSLGPRSRVLVSTVNPLPVAETGLCWTVSWVCWWCRGWSRNS